jgi:membrane-anchored protein YejM (alkaline phosphatase superfamily)
MMEYVKANHPRLVYISYGETDDFAHDGRYDHYLNSAHQTDQWIKAIWEYVQSDPFYKDNTTLIITTDHGRGTSPMTEWKSHGTIYKGADQIWAAAIGPDVTPSGESKKEEQHFQNQIARTVTTILDLDYKGGRYEAGKPITRFLSKKE